MEKYRFILISQVFKKNIIQVEIIFCSTNQRFYYFSVPNVGSKKNNFFKSHINIHITVSSWIVQQNIIWDGVVYRRVKEPYFLESLNIKTYDSVPD